jgi:hypothetical protein
MVVGDAELVRLFIYFSFPCGRSIRLTDTCVLSFTGDARAVLRWAEGFGVPHHSPVSRRDVLFELRDPGARRADHEPGRAERGLAGQVRLTHSLTHSLRPRGSTHTTTQTLTDCLPRRRSLVDIMHSRRDQENFQLIVITHDMHFAQVLGQREHADYYWRITKDDNQHSHIECENIYE